MIAAGWTWPAAFVIVGICVTFGFIATAAMASRYARSLPVGPGLGSSRLDEIEEDLAAIRADLAELKESIAELDRVLKSVG